MATVTSDGGSDSDMDLAAADGDAVDRDSTDSTTTGSGTGSGELELDNFSAEDGIAGQTGSGSDVVTFSSTIADDGEVIALYDFGDDQIVQVTLMSDEDAIMTFGGADFTGHGALNEAQMTALDDLISTDPGGILAHVPMALGCEISSSEATNETDAQRAALVMPWQMLIKYSTDYPTVQSLESEGSCRYLFNEDDWLSGPRDEDVFAGYQRPGGLMLSTSDIVPFVIGFFPFDEVGAVDPDEFKGHGGRPCGALCPGTCGPDCEPAACSTRFEWECLLDADGNNIGDKKLIKIWRCGSHQGCRDHDSCYDGCNILNGCGSWGAATCRRACDTACIAEQGYNNCVNWMNGNPPYDEFNTYRHTIIDSQTDHAMCPVPIDCEVSEWDEWSECDATCGGGTQYRSRTATTQAEHGGEECPELSEMRECNTDDCSVDCEVSEWTEWDECDAVCDGGSQNRYRSVTAAREGVGASCPELTQTQACNEDPCGPPDVDCVMTSWGDWDDCSALCGGGSQSRYRFVSVSATGEGKSCPTTTSETQDCNMDTCPEPDPVDCELGDWSEWSTCDAECDGGSQSRYRSVLVEPVFGGSSCEDLYEEQQCNVAACNQPVDCVMTDWSNWSTCSAECDGGSQVRWRSVSVFPENGGLACDPTQESQDCNTDACADPEPVDCIPGDWSDWSSCSTECGGGIQFRQRDVSTPAAHGGADCIDLFEEQVCNEDDCPEPDPIDCVEGVWSDWSSCSAECGGGTQFRQRDVLTYPEHGGIECEDLQQTQDCNSDECTGAIPVNCEVGEWGEWSTCSAECDGGFRSRSREITVPAENGGADCPSLWKEEGCNEDACPDPDPIDCVMDDWGDWSTCSADCDGGMQYRTRDISIYPEHGGTPCGEVQEVQECNQETCVPDPVDCVAGDWSDWSVCSAECDGGYQYRSRDVTTPASDGGTVCDLLYEEQDCNLLSCPDPDPVDCELGDWGEWSLCSAECDGGYQIRTREIVVLPKNGGLDCDILQDWMPCNEHACTDDCGDSCGSEEFCRAGSCYPLDLCAGTCTTGETCEEGVCFCDAVNYENDENCGCNGPCGVDEYCSAGICMIEMIDACGGICDSDEMCDSTAGCVCDPVYANDDANCGCNGPCGDGEVCLEAACCDTTDTTSDCYIAP